MDEYKIHYYLFISYIELISTTLKQDICDLGYPGAQAAEVDEKRINDYLPWELRYAYRY